MKKVITITILLTVFINTTMLPYHTLLKTTAWRHHIKKQANHQRIATHFYCVTCLHKSIYFLSRLDQQHYCYNPCNYIEQQNSLQLESTIFSHPTICNYIKQAINSQSLRPILLLLKYTEQTLNAQSDHFLHETLILIFVIHKHILFNECAQHHHPIKKSTLETIIMINNIISQLPIAEVLNAIDMLVNELPPFIEKYELNSQITWKNWLKKYWWVPPVFGVWFGLKILLKLQRPYYFYSTYLSPLSPRPQIPLEPIITNDPALLEIRTQNAT